MAAEIRQSAEHFAAHVTPVLRALVAACVVQELLQIREHHAAAALHTLVHFQCQVRDDEVTFQSFVRIKRLLAELAMVRAIDTSVWRCLKIVSEEND